MKFALMVWTVGDLTAENGEEDLYTQYLQSVMFSKKNADILTNVR